jgi:gliding motility-associated-like protein
MKKLILLLLTFTFIGVYGQNCPFLGPDQYLPCGVNTATLTADLSQCGPGSGPNGTSAYTVTQIPYVAQTNNGNLVQLSDDSQSGVFNIGFTFCYYGSIYTQFRIGSNGWVSLGAGAQPATFTSLAIPTGNAAVPKNCIMGPWQDWHPGIGGQIRYQVQGVAPCRKLVVSWIGVPMFSCTNQQGTFHIVLYESTNMIENHIQNKPNCPQWAGGTSVQGIHNLTGTQAVTVAGRNSTQWTAQNDARRWTPSGPPIPPVLVWYQVGNPVPIAQGVNQITVTPPPGGANYTCHLEYGACNAGWSSCNQQPGQGPDTVLVVPGPPTLPAPNVVAIDPTCNNACDGQITINPVGGTNPITISWNLPGNSFTINNLCPGNYTYNLIDAAGCTYNSSVTINNPPVLPAPQIVGVDPVCFNDCNGTATANAVGGVAPYTYLWNNNQNTQTATGLCSGTYNVTVFDVNNCPAQGTITLNNPPQVTITPISGSDTICFGSNTSQYFVTNQPGYNYVWQSVGNITSGQGTNNVDIDWSNQPPGFIPGAIQVVGYNQLGCASLPSVFDLTIFRLNPVIDNLGPFCSYDNCENLTAQPSGGFFTINGTSVSQFCPQTNSSNDTIVYFYTQSGCTFTDSTNFVVNPQPSIIEISPENQFIELCEGDSASITYDIQSNLNGFVNWNINNNQIQGSNTITTTWSSFGTFQISATLTTPEGCTSNPISTILTIQECPNLLIYIPNSFTPDGDEHNNTWMPIFTAGFDPQNISIYIYNRWGQMIWESHNANVGWDGTYNNTLCQTGVYVYKIIYGNLKNDAKKTIIGHLTLLK